MAHTMTLLTRAVDPQTPPKWTWSVLHEAIRQCNHSPDREV